MDYFFFSFLGGGIVELLRTLNKNKGFLCGTLFFFARWIACCAVYCFSYLYVRTLVSLFLALGFVCTMTVVIMFFFRFLDEGNSVKNMEKESILEVGGRRRTWDAVWGI